MSLVEGSGLDELMHRVSTALLDGSPLPPEMVVPPFLVIVQDSNPSRFFPIELSVTDEDLILKPPKGRVWKIHQAFFKFVADVNVANRQVTIETRTSVSQQSVQGYFYETIAATEVHASQIGSQVTNANASGYDTAQDKPILTDDIELSIRATLKEAGDTWECYAVVEEMLNYVN